MSTTPLPTPPSRLIRDLQQHVDGESRFDEASRWLFATDASIYEIPPLGVVFPRTRQAVARLVAVCGEHGVPLHPRGAGTGLAGGCLGEGVVADLSRHLRKIGPIDPDAATVVVEPGVVLDHLNRALASHGLMFGPDPATASRCTLGGMIATNASGAHSILYGKTSDNVVDLEALAADGEEITAADSKLVEGVAKIVERHRQEINRRFPSIQRRVAGYDLATLAHRPDAGLTPLLVGSEGTLAITVRSTLRLVPRPNRRLVAVVCFDDPLEAMSGAVTALDLKPAAVEHIDRPLLEQAAGRPAYEPLLAFLGDKLPAALLCVEFFGESEEELRERLAATRAAFPGRPIHPRRSAGEREQLWALRRAGLGLLMGSRGDAKPVAFMEDTAVEPKHLPEYYRGVREILDHRGLTASFYGHAGVGLLHLRPVIDLHDPAGVATMRTVASEVADLVVSFGGSISGEHGDGLLRSEWLPCMYGDEVVAAFGKVKSLFDPRGLLNPGKIATSPPPRMDERLRYGPGYGTQLPQPPLAFQRDGGWLAAIEQCNGCGGCRKTTGTMCPTYIATGEELLSTRGRANLYRAAATGRLHGGLANDALHEALATCLACKGCTFECPSGVDMALLKTAAVHRSRRDHAKSLADHLLAAPDRLFRRLTPLAPVVNRIAASALGRKLLATTGLDPRRRLPSITREPFRRWFRRRRGSPTGERGAVVLWDDCFTNYLEPEIGRAAVACLEAAGYQVRLIDHLCCGRPAFSQGMVEEARALARENLLRLRPHVEEDLPIVVLEPSCASMLGGDYRELVDGREAASVADHTTSLEGLLGPLLVAEPEALPIMTLTDPILFHPHCHTCATGATASATTMLARLTTAGVIDLQAGCCGMAGVFGYRKERFDLSMAVGSRLFARLDAQPPDLPLVSGGTSCRQQIVHGTDRRPVHPAVLLASLLTHH